MLINDQAELFAFQITPTNVDDRKPVLQLTRDLFGKLFGDKGYISIQIWAVADLETGLAFSPKPSETGPGLPLSTYGTTWRITRSRTLPLRWSSFRSFLSLEPRIRMRRQAGETPGGQ